MKYCIMLSLNYSFVWCTCLNWFEFDLKSIEKIKRKAFRNSRKKEKLISAQQAQSSPVQPRAPASPDRWVPPVSHDPRLRSLPPAARWLQLVGAGFFTRAPAPSRCSVGPPYQRWLPVRESAHAGLWTPPVSLLSFTNLPPVHSAMDAPTSRVSRPLPARTRPLFGARTHSLTLLAQ
jgi:hypothetical protein